MMYMHQVTWFKSTFPTEEKNLSHTFALLSKKICAAHPKMSTSSSDVLPPAELTLKSS